MADWQQYLQSVFLGFIFSFLLAKLFSVIFSFREDNLRIVHGDPVESGESDSKPIQGRSVIALEAEASKVLEEDEPLLRRDENLASESLATGAQEDSDDDWEGVESTELDEEFSAATAFVAATAADRSHKVSNELQLQLYGLFKIATEGPCGAPQPSALKMTARAKWQAWQKLGTMPPEEAMQNYIDIVTELYPSWASVSDSKNRHGQSSNVPSSDNKAQMGPVFSTFMCEEESGNDLKLDAIHAFAREGDMENLLKCIESSVPVDLKDSKGRTPLHWAVDRGHGSVVELLVSRNVDVNAKDNEGQTPLHYAAVCERQAIAEFLVKQNADTDIKDNDGNCPSDLCELNWPWLRHHALVTE